jgi:uncharacterized membrane protein YedE/YeeE
MTIDLTTPALLFPAVSLLLLAYTNRFLALATLIRTLHAQYQVSPDELMREQIGHLRHRVGMIRNMQVFGVLSLLLCVICMFVLFGGYLLAGKIIFAASLMLLIVSLAISVWEVQISVQALNLHLRDMEDGGK